MMAFASLVFLLVCAGSFVSRSVTVAEEKLGSDRLADWIENVERRLQRLETQNQQLEIENQSLKETVLSLRSENQNVKAENVELRASVVQLQDNLSVLNKKVDTLENADSRSPSGVVVTEKTDHVTSAHDVAARSDDVSPLEPVVTQMSQQLTEMNAEIKVLNQAVQEASTSVYVRWGRSVCPSSAVLVYSGVIGGSWYDHTGAATNYLCLSPSPVMSNHAIPAGRAFLYGAEYETFDAHQNKDPVCAVCRSHRPSTVMIPGTNVCLSGWHLEYSGFLMAGRYTENAGSEYICVDSNLENRAGSNPDANGAVLYYTVAQCGSLPCTPYVHGKVVTCVVCSK